MYVYKYIKSRQTKPKTLAVKAAKTKIKITNIMRYTDKTKVLTQSTLQTILLNSYFVWKSDILGMVRNLNNNEKQVYEIFIRKLMRSNLV